MNPSSLPNIKSKREKEKEIVGLMIKIYCKGKKHNNDSSNICKTCQELIDYSNKRIDLCPFIETKTFCQSCRIHCYEEPMRKRIKEVMRYSGPKMIFHHPIITIKHGINMFKSKFE